LGNQWKSSYKIDQKLEKIRISPYYFGEKSGIFKLSGVFPDVFLVRITGKES